MAMHIYMHICLNATMLLCYNDQAGQYHLSLGIFHLFPFIYSFIYCLLFVHRARMTALTDTQRMRRLMKEYTDAQSEVDRCEQEEQLHQWGR